MKSKFKIFPLLLIIFLTIMMISAFYNLIPNFIKIINDGPIDKIAIHLWVLILLFATLIIIINESRIVEIGFKEIEFKYAFPLLNKTYSWNDFDYFVLIDEQSRYETVEAIYLIKDKKLVKVISSFYYKNFNEIKNEIEKRLDFKGKIYINYFSQLFLRLGIKQNKLP